MSCLTTSAPRRSRRVPAAVLIASAAASSHEVLLVPMISVTLYTLMTLSFEHVRPAPELQSHPALSSGVAASMDNRSAAPGVRVAVGDHQADLNPYPSHVTRSERYHDVS